ncbi:hypothetical protein EDD11_010299 [Mortierella claussenii]|nr:hypothetical protein EDD11_010299 [Mortierella claussenii]
MSDPHNSTLYKPGDCPPALSKRHHRRSVDRVWPPALEIRLARLSMKEGSSSGPHIIPPPPPVSRTLSCEDRSSPEEERGNNSFAAHHRLKSIQESRTTTSTSSELGSSSVAMSPTSPGLAVSGSELGSDSGTFSATMPSSASDKRRNSILGPLSPSLTFQMDRQLFYQHTHPSRIDIQYRKRCKSLSSARGDSKRGDGEDGDNEEDSIIRIGSVVVGTGAGAGIVHEQHPPIHLRANRRLSMPLPMFSPLAQSPGGGFFTLIPRPTQHALHMMSTMEEEDPSREYGMDLFQNSNNSSSNGGSHGGDGKNNMKFMAMEAAFADNPVSEFQERLEHLAATGAPPQLSMPHHQPYCCHAVGLIRREDDLHRSNDQDGDERDQEHARDRRDEGQEQDALYNADENRSNSNVGEGRLLREDGDEGEGSGTLPLSLPPPQYQYSWPSISPMRKNPLSAASTRASSTQGSRTNSPLEEKITLPWTDLQESSYSIQTQVNSAQSDFECASGSGMSSPSEQQRHSQHSNNNKRPPGSEHPSRGYRPFVMTDEQEYLVDRMPYISDGGTMQNEAQLSNVQSSLPSSSRSSSTSPRLSKHLEIQIPNDQDRWRSPTLSALGSPRTQSPSSRARTRLHQIYTHSYSHSPLPSPIPSPFSSPLRVRSMSPSGLSTGTAIAMAMSVRRPQTSGAASGRGSRHQALFRDTSMGRRTGEDSEGEGDFDDDHGTGYGYGYGAEEEEEVDMRVEIPRIEAHDDVSLQDIWRMEDEERRDRMHEVGGGEGDGGIDKDDSEESGGSSAHMKGEIHAHEEAKLIQQVLHGHHQHPHHHLSVWQHA